MAGMFLAFALALFFALLALGFAFFFGFFIFFELDHVFADLAGVDHTYIHTVNVLGVVFFPVFIKNHFRMFYDVIDRFEHRVGVFKAFFGLFLHRFADYLRHAVRNGGVQLLHVFRRVVDLHHRDSDRRIRGERELAGEHFVEQHAHRIEVRSV